MSRAYSLVETLVGMAISLGVFGATIGLTRNQVSQHLANRKAMRQQASLEMAGDELDDLLSSRDHQFWGAMDLQTGFIHASQFQSEGLACTDSCPDEFDSGCFILFDIVPVRPGPILKVSTSDFPTSLQITGQLGTAELPELDEVAVLQISDGVSQGLVLVSSIQDPYIHILSGESHPWEFPASIFRAEAEACFLGTLSILHVGLKRVGGTGEDTSHRLVFRPFVWRDGQWIKKRSYSSYQNLGRLAWDEQLQSCVLQGMRLPTG